MTVKTLARQTTWLILLALVGCAPGATTAPGGVSAESSGPRVVKTISIAMLNPVRAFSSEGFSNTAGGGASLAEIHLSGLITNDAVGALEPRLAARVPSLSEGTVVVQPDGRMRTTWNLRPNVKWHDGTPFTAEDLVFSWQVAAEPSIPTAGSAEIIVALVESVQAVDPLTAVITWKAPYYRALELGHREMWPLPRHLIEAQFRADKEAFLNLPYWSTEYVHLGPFRLVDFGLGEQLVFERFDDYFLGPPKVDRITIQRIADPNTILANLKAGGLTMVSEMTLPFDVSLSLREEWQRTGEGTVYLRQANWWYYRFQFDPGWARPEAMTRDVRPRRALFYALDRDSVREAVFPGLPDTSADTFMPSSDPRKPTVGVPFARYRYDPALALQEFTDAGWRRAADGRLLGSDGQHVQLEVRGGANNIKEIALAADFWRQFGIDAVEHVIPGAQQASGEYRTKFPGVEFTARGSGDQIFTGFDGRLHSLPQNRWTGANRSHYASAALDSLIDRLQMTIDEREQGLILRSMGEIMATDLPAVPLYFAVNFAAVAKEVRALANDYAGTRGPGNGPGLMSRNAHLWDRV